MTLPASLAALRASALSLQENATYLLKELPNVQMTESLRLEMVENCDSLIATKHDVISALAEIDELAEPGSGSKEILRRLEHCLSWVRQDIDRLHKVVVALQSETQKDATATPGYILVVESAVNMMKAFLEAKKEVDEFAQRSIQAISSKDLDGGR